MTEANNKIQAIVMYHADPPQAKGVTVNCHWNSWMAARVVEEALELKPAYDYRGQINEKLNEAIERAYNAVIPEAEYDLRERDSGMDVYTFSGDRQDLINWSQDWAIKALDWLPNVGGDDTYFDYYPDWVYGLLQLCLFLEYPDPYEKVRLTTLNGRYSHDPEAADMFPSYLEVKGL